MLLSLSNDIVTRFTQITANIKTYWQTDKFWEFYLPDKSS
jgi:hypothetical protein